MENRWTKIDSSAEWKWDLNEWHIRVCTHTAHTIHKTDNFADPSKTINEIVSPSISISAAQTNEWKPFEQCTNNAFDRVRFIVWKPYFFSFAKDVRHDKPFRQTNFRNLIIIWRNATWYICCTKAAVISLECLFFPFEWKWKQKTIERFQVPRKSIINVL